MKQYLCLVDCYAGDRRCHEGDLVVFPDSFEAPESKVRGPLFKLLGSAEDVADPQLKEKKLLAEVKAMAKENGVSAAVMEGLFKGSGAEGAVQKLKVLSAFIAERGKAPTQETLSDHVNRPKAEPKTPKEA